MKQRHKWLMLALIFIAVLGTRLFFAFSTHNFSDDRAYFALRQVEHIRETGLPLFNDGLSYGGRTYFFTPIFHYIIAFFSLFMPLTIAAKLIPNILASLLVIVIYLLSEEIVSNHKASLFSAFIVGFIPVFFSNTINSVSVYTLVYPLMFYALFCFVKINKEEYLYKFLLTLFLLALTHPTAILFVIGLVIYLLLIKLENLKQSRAEIEVILFSTFLVVWILFLVFKNALLTHGFFVIWQNIPRDILINYFSDTPILKAVYQIGSVPLLYGAYAIFKHIYSGKNRKIYLLISFVFSTTLLLWLKLIEPNVGLTCIGIVMAVLFAEFYKISFLYLKKTRFARWESLVFISYLVTFIATSVVPSVVYADTHINNALSAGEFDALTWLKHNSDPGSVVFSDIYDGHKISFIAERKNVADSNFLLQKDAEQRYKDIEKAYKTMFETEAIRIFNEYNATYIYFSPAARKDFDIETLAYAENEKCFKPVFERNQGKEDYVAIYSVLCRMK